MRESFEAIRSLPSDIEITALVSRNGVIVLKWYELWKELKTEFKRVMVEKGPNQPFMAGKLQAGYYDTLFVTPTSANTVAKIAHGIADSLITNCVAQSCKGQTPVYLYPVDQRQGSLQTTTPGGKVVNIRTRKVDLDNVDKIRRMEGISVLDKPSGILSILKPMT